MKLKFYEYQKCGTCQKAVKFLNANQIEYEKIPIREKPPTIQELKKMLSFGKEIKKLFNTSGKDYKEMNLKEKVGLLTESEILEMLSSNGNLIKRPFLLGKDFGLVGFQEEEWKEKLLK